MSSEKTDERRAAVPSPRRTSGRRRREGSSGRGTSGRRTLPTQASFVVAALALALVFFSSGTPVPLYNTYRQVFGVTSADLALTTVLYLVMTACSLLFLGRLSDALGRRRVGVAAVLVALLGGLVLTQVDGVLLLVLGRVLQGVACGVATSALGAYVVELAPPRPQWLAPVVTGNVPSFAIPLGALGSGALVQFAPAPRHLVFACVAAALLVCAALLAVCRETVAAPDGRWAASLRPQVRVPAGRRSTVVAVGAALLATWSLSGFFQAFSPSLTADQLGSSSPLLAAVVFASIVVLSPVGGALTGRLPDVRALRVGAVVFALATVVVVVAVHASSAVPLLAASLVGGVALGAVGAAGMRTMLAGSAPGERAGIIATVYLISYSGAAVPGLIGGQLSHVLDVADLATAYGVLVVVAVGVSLCCAALSQRGAGRV